MLNYIKYIFYLLSFLIPRNKNKWVFGSYSYFAENPKYLLLYLKDKHQNYNNKKQKYIWIAKNNEEVQFAESVGVKSYLRHSFLGFFHCYTAGIYVYSSYINDINFWTSRGAVKINLWHGIGIKNIERKITKGASAKIYNDNRWYKRLRNLSIHIKPDGLLSTSPMMNKHFMNCFEIGSERIIESIYPRCALFKMSKDELSGFVKQYATTDIKELIEKTQNYLKTYIYMPTWRDSDKNFIEVTGLDFELLDSVLKDSKSLMIFKLHPNSQLNTRLSSYSNIVVVNPKMDIYPVLPYTDCLITDYSSIYYDYILLKDKQVLFYIPDYQSYITNDRELAFDYNECTSGMKVYNFGNLADIIRENRVETISQTDIIKKFWGGNNYTMEDLYSKIQNLVR